MQDLGGSQSSIYFTHVSPTSQVSLDRLFSESTGKDAKASVSAHTISVLDLMKSKDVPLEKVCLLDPKATQEISPEDGNGVFEWFLFGVRRFLLSPHDRQHSQSHKTPYEL